jgi:hypothetical protein
MNDNNLTIEHAQDAVRTYDAWMMSMRIHNGWIDMPLYLRPSYEALRRIAGMS